jgi:hypothetical protein
MLCTLLFKKNHCFSKITFFTMVFLCFLPFQNLKAQISTLPATEGFEAAFKTGINSQFIPNWTANEIQVDTRIYRDSIHFRSGKAAISILPTSGFSADIKASLNLSTYKNTFVTLYAKSIKYGEGTRPANLSIQTSIDNGLSWSTAVLVGVFDNKDTSGFRDIRYNLPSGASFQSKVIVRFLVARGLGTGTAAQLVMDDISFDSDANDNIPPEITAVKTISASQIQINVSEALASSSTELSNFSGIANLNNATLSGSDNILTLQFNSPFINGKQQQLIISNIKDVAGNTLSTPYTFNFIYNNTVPELVITEIMYNTPESNNDSLEFLELHNASNIPIAIGGLSFKEGVEFTFPEYTLPVGGYYLISISKLKAEAFYSKPFAQWSSGALNNAGESIVLQNSEGTTIDSVRYVPFWGGDGDGSSLVLCNPTSDNTLPENWSLATANVGTIGEISVKANPGSGCENFSTPQINFVFKDMLVEEDSLLTVIVKLSNGNGNPVSGTIAYDNTSNLSASEWTANPTLPYTFNFDGTQTEDTLHLKIQLNDDEISELFETLILRLESPSNASIGLKNKLTITVRESEINLPALFINEVMASNTTYAKDEYNEYDDWVEIYNPSNTPVDIADYYLTDKRDNLKKYRFPKESSETIIPAKGFKVIWLDEQSSQGVLHTNFKLNALGEFIAIVYKDGTTLLDSVAIPVIDTDVSLGRQTDGNNPFIIFEKPTIGRSNHLSTSIFDQQNPASFKVYPNPATKGFIKFSKPDNYRLIDLSGKTLKQQNMTQEMNITDIESGIYFIINSKNETFKLIVLQ